MKRCVFFVVVLTLVLASCGLKVPTSVVAGSDSVNGSQGLSSSNGTSGPTGSTDSSATKGTNGGPIGTDPTKKTDQVVGEASSALFPRETEGVTKDQITLCAHVPITGASPIQHDVARFGQFYFDYVNKELGGVYGRKVRFRAIDDGYYPAGARNAVEKCAREGAFIYLGSAGTDQIVSVARWAEGKKVPYLHGPTSDRDLGGFKYNIFGGPTYEDQHRLLARYLVKRFGTHVKYGMVRVNSIYFDAGHDAYVSELKKLGVTLDPSVDFVVQKDETAFSNIFFAMDKVGTADDVKIINNFTTPNIWLKMLRQKPAGYSPTWTAVSPVAGFNIIAAGLAGTGSGNDDAIVFNHFSPACNCTDYKNLDQSLPWTADIKEFLRIFGKYSPEQKPPPDDFDYAAYLAAKAFYRLLLKLGPDPTRTKLFTLLNTYKEDPKVTFPGCGLDFTHGGRRGAHNVNVFELKVGKWKQTSDCVNIDTFH